MEQISSNIVVGDRVKIEAVFHADRGLKGAQWDDAIIMGISNDHLRIKTRVMAQAMVPHHDAKTGYFKPGYEWPVGVSKDTMETVKIEDIIRISKLT